MKTKLLILAVAVLALASCSNDEVVQTAATSDANTISFRPLMTGVTRAAAKSAFADNDVIDVWADYKSAKYFQDDYKFASGVGFTSTTPHYWPSDVSTNNVKFTAVYGSTTNDGTRTKLTTRCRVAHAPHTAAASQTDMLVAQHTSSTKETTVTLNFRHALSQIVVQAKNTNPNLKVSIRGVRVGFVAQEGYLLYEGDTDLRQAETDGSITGGVTLISTIQWHNDSPSNANANKYDQTGLTATELVGNASDAAHTITGFSNWMLLPQTMREHTTESSNMVYTTQENGSATGDPKLTGSYLALYMKVENYYNSAVNGEIVAYQWCYWPITTIWKPGYKYTYTIDTASGGYQPQDINNDKVYDPVLDGTAIKFDVDCTIDEWVPAAIMAYNETSGDVFYAPAAGTYSFTITNVPASGASSYSLGLSGGGDIFVGTPTISANTTTSEASGNITITFEANGSTGTKDIYLKLGGTTKMTITVHRIPAP